MSELENTPNKHFDEITLLLYVERQLDRDSAQEVSLHTQTCTSCLTLLHALDRESRLLAENALRFQVASNLMRSHIRTLRSAIQEGKTG